MYVVKLYNTTLLLVKIWKMVEEAAVLYDKYMG